MSTLRSHSGVRPGKRTTELANVAQSEAQLITITATHLRQLGMRFGSSSGSSWTSYGSAPGSAPARELASDSAALGRPGTWPRFSISVSLRVFVSDMASRDTACGED